MIPARFNREGFLSIPQAARAVKIPEHILHKHCKAQTLKNYTLEGQKVIFTDHLTDWQKRWGGLAKKSR
jgi:hypothetical protein